MSHRITSEETCRTCHYWEYYMDGEPTGACLRYAARPVLSGLLVAKQENTAYPGNNIVQVVWPSTFYDGWCGEWAALMNDDEPVPLEEFEGQPDADD